MTSLPDLQEENARLKALLADAAKALEPFARAAGLAESLEKDSPSCSLNWLGRKFAAARTVQVAIVLADALSHAGRRKAELTLRAIAARRERLIRARAAACVAVDTARLPALGHA